MTRFRVRERFTRLRAWKCRVAWCGWPTARDPLASLVRTAQRLDYGAGWSSEADDEDEQP
ncbi:hypothetical protein ABZT06_14255 [Streptomyces sp. NPDC005483]|uniref:hypothetical protein n=1 Tax=Streptomyces sp. NPDC005483 TaxID=3154882 RepID=UPI0033A1521C